MKLILTSLFTFIIGFALAQSTIKNKKQIADVIYVNGKFVTLDAKNTIGQAVAIKDGKILQVGSIEQIKALANVNTKTIDLHGKTVLPGFIDGHAHPSLAMLMKQFHDGRGNTTPSVAVLLDKIKSAAATTPAGEWIVFMGSSSSQTRFTERRLPTRAEFDAAAPNNPVWFLNGSHETVVNSAALSKLGIAKGVAAPTGVHVDYDANGEPTGVLQEPMSIFPFIKVPDADLRRYFVDDTPKMWNAQGYTSILAIVPAWEFTTISDLANNHTPLKLRYTFVAVADPAGQFIPHNFKTLAFPSTVDANWYRFGGIKVWVDSDIPIKGGAVSEPYPGGGNGVLNFTQGQLNEIALRAHKMGVPMFAHATGDRATAMTLTAFEWVKQQDTSSPHTLQRIEHFGEFIIGPNDLARAKRLGVYGNITPIWVYTLGQSMVENLGPERARGSYRFRDMIDAGIQPGAGTDLTGVYFDSLNPFDNIWAAVTRNSDIGSKFTPEQAVTVDEALRMWTIWAARAQEEDAIKGSLEAGKLADMIVISGNILTIPAEQIRNLKVLKTIVGGQEVYSSKK